MSDTDKKLFIPASELKSTTGVIYMITLVIGVSASFIAYSYFVTPLALAATIPLSVYYGGIFAISFLWVGITKLINKYWLQNKLISKGEILCSSNL